MFQPVHQWKPPPISSLYAITSPPLPPHPIQSPDFRTLTHSHGIKTFICVSPPAWPRFERRKQTCTRWWRDGRGWSPRSRARCSSNRLFRTVTRSTLISNVNFLHSLLSFFFLLLFFFLFFFFFFLFLAWDSDFTTFLFVLFPREEGWSVSLLVWMVHFWVVIYSFSFF